MKKYLLIALVAILSIGAANAQRNTLPVKAALSATYGNVLDTVTNTSAHYMKTVNIPASVGITAIATFTNITGTVGGTASIERSLDGTTGWSTMYYPGTSTALQTFSLSNTSSQSVSWDLAGWLGGYYRIKIVGSGSTHSYTIGVKYTAYARQ